MQSMMLQEGKSELWKPAQFSDRRLLCCRQVLERKQCQLHIWDIWNLGWKVCLENNYRVARHVLENL